MDESSGDSKQSPVAHSQDSVGEISTLATTTPTRLMPAVYRGKKGSFHTKHKNPRTVVETDWHQKFVENFDDEEAERLLHRYFHFNGNPATKKQAEGMISIWIEKGARELMYREVFRIGGGQFYQKETLPYMHCAIRD